MDNMLTNFIDKIHEIQSPDGFEINGRNYITKKLYPLLEPEPTALHLSTLTGLVNYLSHNVDKLDFEQLLVHVAGHDTVNLYSSLQGTFAQRFRHISVTCDTTPFPFDTFMSQPQFMIRLQCDFVPTAALETLSQYAGNVVNEAVKTLADDGVSQRATVKTGVSSSMRKNEVAPRTIKLKPYRTFHEVEQCESAFVFRMRQAHEDANVEMALFSAQADRWRLEAVKAIAKWLEPQLPVGIGIIA
jgi:hypothetical protein